MIKTRKLRGLLEARIGEAEGGGLSAAHGRVRFVQEVRASLGLCEEVRNDDGTVSYIDNQDQYGRPKLGKDRISPSEYSLRGLAEAIGGQQFIDTFDPSEGADAQQRIALMEAGPGIDPTTFVNTNLFNLATAGLVEAAILEKYEDPTYIGDQLFTVMPTKMNGQKIIGTGGIGDKGLSRKPGQPHPRAGFGEQWVKTPELDEKALAVEVQQEAVFYDLTGQVLERAGSVGLELGYRQEVEKIDAFIGVTNTYSYNDTTYNTYQTATPWINSASNPFTDYMDYDDARLLLLQMTDPMTGKEILIQPDTIVCSPEYQFAHARQINATQVQERTQSLARVVMGPNPIGPILGQPTVLGSQIFRNRHVAASGLNLGSTNGPKYWYYGQPKKMLRWMEAWPLRVKQASADEYVMLDRGLICAYFANYRGVPAVIDPRYVIQNKN